ncbi:pyridoxamine 5'-phosphate oxidase family protein [Streptomyces spiramenti]|uniref:Pyridoxamine 5'-phosphate oxidase N-terminal domain-containing protein n=1 Tax=Streptomyces spiramenti TaxID=2720606 RepID=A0ABX1AT44_9ACTN|nr:pyridoxamine 5'-phosphate oxidase family protein [Streptomyces spiramenti]NJP68906.1 hypothetical protein [Streptomyces spiramenti]
MAEISGPGRGPDRTSGRPIGEGRADAVDEAAPGERGWLPPAAAAAAHRPGSAGQWSVQERLGTTEAARRFHAEQVVGRLNRRMREFVARQEMFFLATSDRFGECHSTLRAGPPGFLRALDEQTLVYPEYRGSGVHASLGNIAENPHAGLLLLDFERARIGLHVNGRAHLVDEEELRERHPEVPSDPAPGRRARMWVRIDVITAHIHGATHIPHLVGVPKRAPREWGSQDYRRRGGDFFGVARGRAAEAGPGAVPPRPRGAPAGDTAADTAEETGGEDAGFVPGTEPHPADPPPGPEAAAEHGRDEGANRHAAPPPEDGAPAPLDPPPPDEVTYVSPLRLDDPAPVPPVPPPGAPGLPPGGRTTSGAARGGGPPAAAPAVRQGAGPDHVGAGGERQDTAVRPPERRDGAPDGRTDGPGGSDMATEASRTTAALQALREQAERALAEAERRGRRDGSASGAGGWFGEG